MSRPYTCAKCRDTGIVEYQALDGFQSFQWARWKKRACDCKTASRKTLPLGEQ